MFEFLLLIGFFMAGISQLLPDESGSGSPERQGRKKGERLGGKSSQSESRKSKSGVSSVVMARHHGAGHGATQCFEPLRYRVKSSAGIGLAK